jgi:glycosyltransferase involved in cell wall biosynthesis
MPVKIMFVCTVPALSSYGIGIISAAFKSKSLDCYACVFLENSDRRSFDSLLLLYGIPVSKSHQFIVHRLAKNKVIKILSIAKYLNAVAAFAHMHQVKKIHFLTQDVMLQGHLHQFKDFDLYYTVHDLIPHQAKLSLLQRIKHYYFRIRKDRILMARIRNLVTNSISQKVMLEQLYPGKNVFFHHMPSLVTKAIMAGNIKLKELTSIKNYVLFFGRIEPYKGIEQLYQAFTAKEELTGIQLVIAGKGNIYFKRDLQREAHVTFINRYIADEEVNDLFDKAIMLVLPYHSATQSAVTSLAYHYRLPVLASAIEALKDTVKHEETGLLFTPNNADEMGKAILKLISDKAFYQKIRVNLQHEQTGYRIATLISELELLYN